jgi:hypothetical protein
MSALPESATPLSGPPRPDDLTTDGVLDLEIVAHSEHQTDYGTLHDVTVERSKDYKCHKIMAVPPEEFGISRTARNIKDATYCFHEVRRTQIDLIQDGYDEDQVRSLPDNSGEMQTNTESMARDSVDETQMGLGGTGANRATRWITTTEHHLWMDYEQNGKASLYRVMTGGPQGEILLRNGKLQIMEENHIPMAAMTPVIITHRLIGRSIADLVMDIQRIKTALMRALLDNTYMAVNPRPEVAEAFATEQTLDDLLVMRPGQPIRVKQPGGINWQQVPFVGEQILPVMQFMDTTREWRTGVNRQSQGVDPNALQNQVATIANQMQSASDQKVKLIARIFAETGIKDLFQLLHAEIRENGDQQQVVRLRNTWVPVDPTQWKERQDMTINVGLGTGQKHEELAKLQLLIGAQTQAVQVGLVSRQNLYNSAKELVRLSGRKDVDSYFLDPSKPPEQNDPASQPIPPPSDPNQAKAQADMQANQAKMQLEAGKAQADQQREAAQAQSEIAIANQKFELEKQLKLLDAEIAARKHQMEMESNAQKMALANQKAQQGPKRPGVEISTNGQALEIKHTGAEMAEPMAQVVHTLGQHLTNLLNSHTATITSALDRHSGPKRIRKLGNGEYVTEPVKH